MTSVVNVYQNVLRYLKLMDEYQAFCFKELQRQERRGE